MYNIWHSWITVSYLKHNPSQVATCTNCSAHTSFVSNKLMRFKFDAKFGHFAPPPTQHHVQYKVLFLALTLPLVQILMDFKKFFFTAVHPFPYMHTTMIIIRQNWWSVTQTWACFWGHLKRLFLELIFVTAVLLWEHWNGSPWVFSLIYWLIRHHWVCFRAQLRLVFLHCLSS